MASIFSPSQLLNFFSPDKFILLLDLYRAIRKWIVRKEGMYEILDYETTLELKDTRGKTAVFKKQLKVKFIQDHIIAFEDYVWGDGKIFAEYKCTPGFEADRYKEGDRWNVLISLRETKNNGDITDFYIERVAENGFTKDVESLQTEVRHHTKRLKMAIIFPKTRRCQRAVLIERTRKRTTVLGPENFTNLPDGRQKVAWETTKIRRFEIYTIQWKW